MAILLLLDAFDKRDAVQNGSVRVGKTEVWSSKFNNEILSKHLFNNSVSSYAIMHKYSIVIYF